ncbi:MAG: ACP S-malonyltransferase [Chlamydiae bacterium]|nr:ACP S-malonyltransferase [Chlamydiota bacterium]
MTHYKKIALLFPGQGAQYVGMGKDLYEAYPVAKQIFQEADELLGRGLSSCMFMGNPEDLAQTKNSQPAIYVMSFALWRVLQQRCPRLMPSICAGLSLGEYTALAAAGKISFLEGLQLVAKRAELMQEACEKTPGSLRVVLGLDEEAVATAIASCPHYVCIANLNCPGQVVIAGSIEGLDAAVPLLKEAGAKRVLPLDVSGAFHSELMRSAREGLAPYLQKVSLHETSVDLVMNVVGDFVCTLPDIRALLTCQVTSPVRWQKGIETMQKASVDCFLEVGCGKTLQGMNKRIGIEPTWSIETVEDIEKMTAPEGALHAFT